MTHLMRSSLDTKRLPMPITFLPLGQTGIEVSNVAFGAGPIPELMTEDAFDQQVATLARALEVGINWIDTAATYGGGQSESSLGRTLGELDAFDKFHVASKARIMPDEVDDIPATIERSVRESLERLNLRRLTLLQLHNSITTKRGEEPTSLTPEDALGPVLKTFKRLQSDGLVEHIGLTAIGQPEAMRRVVDSGEFATIQVPYNILNSSAGDDVDEDFEETDYGNIIQSAANQKMGVFAIRVFAGGAIFGHPPAKHTYKTKFFPMDLYQRDSLRAEKLLGELGSIDAVRAKALNFVCNDQRVTSAIVGFSDPRHVDDAIA